MDSLCDLRLIIVDWLAVWFDLVFVRIGCVWCFVIAVLMVRCFMCLGLC